MATYKDVHRIATNIANCFPTNLENKRLVRSTVVDAAIVAVEAYRRDPSTLDELRAMAKYGN
jgi:hypothetical protein